MYQCSTTRSLKSSNTKLTCNHLPATSLLTGDGLRSAVMHHKQNNITVCVAGGTDTLEPEQASNMLVALIYGAVSHCTHRVKGERVVHDSACWVLKAPRESGRDRGCCGGRAEETIQARSRPQAAGAGGGSPPPLRPRHLPQNGTRCHFTQFLHKHCYKIIILLVIIINKYDSTFNGTAGDKIQ